MGAGTLGGIQADATIQRVQTAAGMGGRMVLASVKIANPEFENARTASPSLIEVSVDQKSVYLSECFGPVVFIIKTNSREQALELVKESAQLHGAITCLAYTTDEAFQHKVEEEMNAVFTPVSFNFTGALFVNQHAAFSDFHVSGGNPAGNATFTNPEYINKRFVWVGNRFAV
jgi:acyl-CoA reductase-like NAD-dependent aldehyde dehydrogenase